MFQHAYITLNLNLVWGAQDNSYKTQKEYKHLITTVTGFQPIN